MLQYSPTEGDPALIELVTADLQTRLSIDTADHDVVVTTGSQQALDLAAKVLIDPGDIAVVERPAYVGALRALSSYQAQIVGVPVDDDGMDTAHLAALLDDGLRPKLCYVVPNFSNPSGATMNAARRAHLAELSERYGFVVLEDDPYGQLRFAGTDVAPIASHGVGNVLYLGSFSKVVAPALRVGYLTAPAWLARPMVIAKQATDLTSSAFNQRLIVELLTHDPDWLAGHIETLRAVRQTRRPVTHFARPARGRPAPPAPTRGWDVRLGVAGRARHRRHRTHWRACATTSPSSREPSSPSTAAARARCDSRSRCCRPPTSTRPWPVWHEHSTT